MDNILILCNKKALSYNNSYVSSALSSSNVSGSISDMNAVGATKYGDIFVERDLQSVGFKSCGKKCYVGCACNTDNGWSAKAPSSGDYVTATTVRKYDYTDTTSTASTFAATSTTGKTQTCYKAKNNEYFVDLYYRVVKPTYGDDKVQVRCTRTDGSTSMALEYSGAESANDAVITLAGQSCNGKWVDAGTNKGSSTDAYGNIKVDPNQLFKTGRLAFSHGMPLSGNCEFTWDKPNGWEKCYTEENKDNQPEKQIWDLRLHNQGTVEKECEYFATVTENISYQNGNTECPTTASYNINITSSNECDVNEADWTADVDNVDAGSVYPKSGKGNGTVTLSAITGKGVQAAIRFSWPQSVYYGTSLHQEPGVCDTCPTGYYKEQPDGDYFTYTTSGGCYKVTGCNERNDVMLTVVMSEIYITIPQAKPTKDKHVTS